MRLACLFVPLFPLAARLRSEPELKGEAVAIFEGNGNAARVLAAARRARRAGIEAGMTLPQTRALYPRLIARGRDLECERAAQEALLEVAESFSPRVEDGGKGVAYLDLDGHVALRSQRKESDPLPAGAREGRPYEPGLGESSDQNPPATSMSSFVGAGVNAGRRPALPTAVGLPRWSAAPACSAERSIGCELISAAEKAGLPARVGIAASKLAARVAAGLPDSPSVVAPREEASFLAPLPLAKLAPALEIAESFERWGIRSIGELAKLPEGEIASRLGELGRALHAAARGIDTSPLEPRPAPLCLSEGLDLEWPLVTLEPFLFVGNAALERLMRRLESQAIACTRLEVTLKLDPDGHDARAIQLPAPTCDTKTLLTLVRLELEARPPGAPVVGFVFTAHPDKPRRAQLSLFGPVALSPDRLATTIARLASILGADRIGSPRAVDGHRLERFTLTDYRPPPPPRFASPRRAGRGLLVVRVLRPPVELEVMTVRRCATGAENSLTQGEDQTSVPQSPFPTLHSSRPVSLQSLNDASPPISGSVRVASGPWSLEEGWWRSAPEAHPGPEPTEATYDDLGPEQMEATVDRDYWDVELTDGGLYRIYRDRQTSAWFADGIYD
jgi:protein ImuB